MSLCPICFDATGLLTDGARAGAMVLALVAATVIAAFARFAWRILRTDLGTRKLRTDLGTAPPEDTVFPSEIAAETTRRKCDP